MDQSGDHKPEHSVWLELPVSINIKVEVREAGSHLPDAHGDLVGGADPDKVEVCKDPGQPEGQPPGDHDAQVGERQHRQDGQAD